MPNSNAKELFAQKITSREQFDKLLVESGIYRDGGNPARFEYNGTQCYYGECLTLVHSYLAARAQWPILGATKPYWPAHLWWLLREQIRMGLGVYEPTPWDTGGPLFAEQFAVHISKEDRNMLAYTASASDGEADRQVRVAPGKLLRKLNFWLSDADIQGLEAEFRAMMSDDIEFITGDDAIAEAYQNMVGDTGCMRYAPERFGLPDDLHPSMVYDAPGFALAVHRVGDAIKARAVTWVNPDDPTDKRYVRLYGDSVLGRKLDRAGYHHKNLTGAKLKLIPVPGRPNYYVMPYIDMPGGGDGTYGRIEDGMVRLITRREYERITAVNASYAKPLQNTEGVIRMYPIPPSAFSFTCAIDGRTYSKLLHSKLQYLRADGTLVEINESNLPDDAIYVRTASGNYPADPATPRFEYCGLQWLDDEPTRRHHGFVRLSSSFYSDTGWRRLGHDLVQRADGDWIMKADAVRRLVKPDGGPLRVEIRHVSEVADTDVALHRVDGMRVLAAAGVDIYTTPSRRKVHPLTHEVGQRYDGVYDFARNLEAVSVMGRAVYRAKGSGRWPRLAECASLMDAVRANVRQVVELAQQAGRDRAGIVSALNDAVRRSARYFVFQDAGYWQATGWGSREIEPVLELCRALLADPSPTTPAIGDGWPAERMKGLAADIITLHEQAQAALAELAPETPVPADPVNQGRFTVAA